MTKVSYIKTQWFSLLVAILCFTYVIIKLFTTPNAGMTESLENMYVGLNVAFNAVGWTLTGCTWLLMSFINYHEDCLKELEKRIEKLEQRSVTDIDKISDNNYMVRRRLGPDKDIPMPEED